MMVRFFFVLGAIAGGLAVALGAFASHALKERLAERSLAIFETGVRYQMYHALALVLVGIVLSQHEKSSVWLTLSGVGFILGMLIFSGSLYGLALLGLRWMGAITPVGGVAFLFGWGCLAIAAFTIPLPSNP